MKQYRPNVERQKWLYSMMKSRELMRRRRLKRGEISPNKKPVPDNSAPWLPEGVKSVADALWISDQVKRDMERWGIKQQPTT